MIYSEYSDSDLLRYLEWLEEFIKDIESFARKHKIDIENDKIYISATSQRQYIRDILD